MMTLTKNSNTKGLSCEATAPSPPGFIKEDSEYPNKDPGSPVPPYRSGRTSRMPTHREIVIIIITQPHDDRNTEDTD